MSNADLTSQTPAQIDTQLAEIWGRAYQVQDQIDNANRSISEARKMVRAGYKGYENRIETRTAQIEKLVAERKLILAETVPFEAEYNRRGGWTRAYLVNNSNGHVHTSRNCSTTYITTRFQWLIDFSGKSEAEVVDAAGERACTVCYPTAPVEVLSRPTRIFTEDEKVKAAAKAEREAKTAAKDAEKVIHPETGKVLFKTERGATNQIASTLDSFFWYGDHPSNDEWISSVVTIVEALAARRGVDFQPLYDEFVAKAQAKDAKKKAKIVKELQANPNTNWDHVMNSIRVLAGLPELVNN